MLSPYRVLDLTDESGSLCGQILADLGADVIAVEPPTGSSARARGPWLDGIRGGERSLSFAAYARNKRSLALDLETEADRALLLRLVEGADFLVESAAPGWMASRALDYAALRERQPGLVHVSITPFGQDGPHASWAGTDLIAMAAGGFAYLSGDAEGPPLRVRVPQAYAQAGADAAVGALVAHFERARTGLGQHVDVSLQESVTLATMFRSLDVPLGSAPARRLAGALHVGGVRVPIRHRTRDGWVTLGPSILPSTGHFMKRLFEWLAEEGFADEALVEERWGSFGLRLGGGALPVDAYAPAAAALDAFFATKTQAEVMGAAVERQLLIAPVLAIDQIVESEQLAARGFAVPHPVADHPDVRFPGPFAQFQATPIRYRLPPPRLDEHGPALRSEPRRQPAATANEPVGAAPLAGVKILDLCWVLAGPTATRLLADFGATVVRVESTRRLDTLRVSPPYRFNTPHPEGGGGFHSANANKLGVTLDLSTAAGREVVLDLVRWADVVTESFAPGVMERMGLSWETLHGVNPGLVMLSSSIMGQTGPWRSYAGFGRLAVSLTGFQLLGSEPDGPPSGPFGAYTDAVASRYNALAVLAALDHRARTGQGQAIDLSQAEAALHFLAPAFVDWTANGVVEGPVGNADDELAPHGVFRTQGSDTWVAVAIRDDDEWEGVCELIGRRDLARRRTEAAASAALEAWAGDREGGEVEAALQARGVAAHRVLDTRGLFEDPQLQHRGHFIEIAHDVYQTTTVESSRLRLSRSTPRRPERALTLGAHNREVLEGVLGYAPERIAQLAADGVLA